MTHHDKKKQMILPAPSKGSPMEAPTPLRGLHWTPLEGPGILMFSGIFSLRRDRCVCLFASNPPGALASG